MKKILFVLVSLVISVSVFGQARFECQSLVDDSNKWEELAKKHKKWGNRTLSKEIMKTWDLTSDGTVQWQYVMTIDSVINVEDYEKYIEEWISLNYTNATPVHDFVNHSIKVSGYLNHIGQSQGLFSYTTILALQETKIDLKENKIRITVVTKHYKMSKASLSGLNTPTHLIKDCFPHNAKSSDKDAYAMAYININSNTLDKCKTFLDFLNRHINDINDATDNW